MGLVSQAAELHPSMIPAIGSTSSTYEISDPNLQALHDLGIKQLKNNHKDFAPGMTLLVEGGGYNNAWLETQPMGGEMYAWHDLQIALNNQVAFLRTQRNDGRLPGMIVPGSMMKEKRWGEKGFPAGYVPVLEHDLVADYEMFQGYCFPEPAWRMYFWAGKNREYLKQLAKALERHDAYLWNTRDSNGDDILETWCVWDTGEDGSTRLYQRGARDNWPFEYPPGSGTDGKPLKKTETRMPFQSMDIMAYSYSGRAVLASIARELDNGEEEKWHKAAEVIRKRVIDRLWDPARHACFDRDRNGKVLPELIHNNLRCMWYGLFTQEMADAFIREHLLNPEEFWTPIPLPSIAANEDLFLSHPRNNWSGQPQGLTFQRALHALERYGHFAEITLLGGKLLPVLSRNGCFSQQLQHITGEPSESNREGYGPMILAMEGYLTRMHGIHIDPAAGEVWWSGLEPKGNTFRYQQRWNKKLFELKLENRELHASLNGVSLFSYNPGYRVVTDLQGRLLRVAGINPESTAFRIQRNEQKWSGEIAPNQSLQFHGKELRPHRVVPFDFPYQATTKDPSQ